MITAKCYDYKNNKKKTEASIFWWEFLGIQKNGFVRKPKRRKRNLNWPEEK